MNDLSDQQLLREYGIHRTEDSFAEVVRRHIDLVYSAALRIVSDAHLAKDITQAVFLALSKQAAEVAEHPVLSGWLHGTTRNLAAKAVRTETRRRAREREAFMSDASQFSAESSSDDDAWTQIAPHLDDLLGELSPPDRDALLLRYFERKSAREMAALLGIGDEAAQKRVSRAVDRLRELFEKRGLAVGTSGLALLLSAQAVQAAPIGLAVSISGAAGATAALAGTATSTTIVKAIAMTTLQKTLIGATLAVAVGTTVYQAREVSQLRREKNALIQQQEPIVRQVEQLGRMLTASSNQLATLQQDNERLKRNSAELAQLRNQSGLAQTDARELARLKSELQQRAAEAPAFWTNAISKGLATATAFQRKEAEARLARMKKKLGLADAQEQAIREILLSHIERQSQLTMDMMAGRVTPGQVSQNQIESGRDEESEIKAVLTREQVTSYDQYQAEERMTRAERMAQRESESLGEQFELAEAQKEAVRVALYRIHSDGADSNPRPRSQNQADLSAVLADTFERQRQTLDKKLEALRPFLSEGQLNEYRTEAMRELEMQAEAMRSFFPAITNTAAAWN